MAYNLNTAERVREYLKNIPVIEVREQKMIGGLAFMVNDKMCVNISGDRLMCRFDAKQTEEIAKRTGVLPMIMKGKVYKGYCYVEPGGFKSDDDFVFWMDLCLNFNSRAKSSKKQKKS